MDFKNLRGITDDKKRAREKRKRERERKKRRTLKYGQVQLKHSRRGAMSCMLAFCASFLTMLIFSVAYISRGEVTILVGAAGLIALVLSLIGFVRGIQGFKERNKNYITCKLGTGWNAVLLLILIGTLLRGMF